MKTYTDLKQSKKLAEILPIESADMKWFTPADDEGEFVEEASLINNKSEYYLFEKVTDWNDTPYIPCWSLAALMEEMNRNGWKISLECCGAEFTAKFDDGETFVMQYADNAIDAFYKMVVALHEKKML